jgi:hypothetical protein
MAQALRQPRTHARGGPPRALARAPLRADYGSARPAAAGSPGRDAQRSSDAGCSSAAAPRKPAEASWRRPDTSENALSRTFADQSPHRGPRCIRGGFSGRVPRRERSRPAAGQVGHAPWSGSQTGSATRRRPRAPDRRRLHSCSSERMRCATAALALDEMQASAAGDRSPYRSRICGKAGAAAWLPVFHEKRRGTLLRLGGDLSRRLRRGRVPREFPNSRFEPDLPGARGPVVGSS